MTCLQRLLRYYGELMLLLIYVFLHSSLLRTLTCSRQHRYPGEKEEEQNSGIDGQECSRIL